MMHITKTAVYSARFADAQIGVGRLAAGSEVEIDGHHAVVRSTSPAHDERTMQDAGVDFDFIENDYSFDYPAIEAALRKLGATEEEADAATDILYCEGWGGGEYEMQEGVNARNFTEEELRSKIDLVRERNDVQVSCRKGKGGDHTSFDDAEIARAAIAKAKEE